MVQYRGIKLCSFNIPLGQKQVMCDLGKTSGVIQQIWFTIPSDDSLYLQNIIIKITFDDEVKLDNIPFDNFTGIGPLRINDIMIPVF